MSKQYEKTCDRCSQKIKMSDELGKWKAFNISDNKIHECQKSSNDNGNNNDISVEVLLKKLESVGISINLERLRNTINGDKK